jgi:four helix bundle protein
MQSFRNLKVWEKAHSLVLEVYNLTRGFPREELYGLTSQMRRACVSIGANIAEGCCRKGDLELGRFLQIAMGSASELEYELLLARDLKFVNISDFQQLEEQVTEVKRMLAALICKLKADS